jgi:hypothetical protein
MIPENNKKKRNINFEEMNELAVWRLLKLRRSS